MNLLLRQDVEFLEAMRKFVIGTVSVFCVWTLSYLMNSVGGGYSSRPDTNRRLGKDGIAYRVGVVWQPRFGKVTSQSKDLLGTLYYPLIRFDREYWHEDISILDDAGWEAAQRALKVSPHSNNPPEAN